MIKQLNKEELEEFNRSMLRDEEQDKVAKCTKCDGQLHISIQGRANTYGGYYAIITCMDCGIQYIPYSLVGK